MDMRATVATIAVIVALFGGAGPAAADTLVSNLSAATLNQLDSERLGKNNVAQSFTTGTNASGYQLESITLDFGSGVVETTDPVYVYLHEDNGSGRPNHNQGGQVATLTKNGVNFAGPVTGLNKYKVWKARCYPQPPHGGGCLSDPSSVHLEPNTTYWVYVWAGNRDSAAILNPTGLTQTGATGWSIGNSTLFRPFGSPYSDYTQSFQAVKMKVEGTTPSRGGRVTAVGLPLAVSAVSGCVPV